MKHATLNSYRLRFMTRKGHKFHHYSSTDSNDVFTVNPPIFAIFFILLFLSRSCFSLLLLGTKNLGKLSCFSGFVSQGIFARDF